MNESQQTIDPVCGKSVHSDECQFSSDDEKGTHYFCSKDCQNKFDKADAKAKKGFWARYTERLKDVQCSRTSQDCR
ncbi:hypothetical protein DSCO28_37700 [Desulfosarcina ovata subsp. sediminis]|jgi:YHS domain-containing protein|uniref:Uncharacterized protein n=1 Tax=Desulfosarcina ovata subsp. sediminis TaxID=885957 RepID=A0A5K7ZSN2_9BACT|nr:hypothetical protein DSCO28_37700 [Desulfosarcina ovata subsp. sediminis]